VRRGKGRARECRLSQGRPWFVRKGSSESAAGRQSGAPTETRRTSSGIEVQYLRSPHTEKPAEVVEPRGRNAIGGLASTDRWKWTKQGLPCHTASWSGRVRRGGCAERCTFSGDRKRGETANPKRGAMARHGRRDSRRSSGSFTSFGKGTRSGLWISSWTLGSMPVLVTGARVSHGAGESGGGMLAHGELCGTFRIFG